MSRHILPFVTGEKVLESRFGGKKMKMFSEFVCYSVSGLYAHVCVVMVVRDDGWATGLGEYFEGLNKNIYMK